MRQEPNKEIDLLLRQLGRRDGDPVSELDEPHLDADELNSYVANALPAAARARYTEHLADCSNCRRLVARLSGAQGPVAVQESATAAPSGLMSFLTSLFSPMVLRYAVPALGLIVIAVVGIVVLRQQPQGSSVARLENPDQNRPVVQSPAASPAETAAPASPAKREEAPAQRTVVAPVAKDAPAPAPAANQPTGSYTTAEPPPPASKAAKVEDEAQRVEKARKQKQEAAADTPAVPARDPRERTDQPVKNEYQKADQSAATPDSAAPATATPSTASRRALEMRRRERSGTLAGAGQAASPAGEEAKELDVVSETRSVAGRRFQKRGRVWIDTAYNSSRETTDVARGSEQYRALVADEPAIREIAERLDGEIIVVWNGRAYRIR